LLGFVLFAPMALGGSGVKGFGFSELKDQAREIKEEGEKEKQTKPGGDDDETVDFSYAETISGLDVCALVSQLQIVSLRGRAGPMPDDRKMLGLYTPGAVVIPSLVQPKTAVKYVKFLMINPLMAEHGIPILIGTKLGDLPVAFGGEKDGIFAPLPSMLTVAAADSGSTTRKLAGLYAEHLDVMGFSFQIGPCLSLAPVLPDVRAGKDCLGSDPVFIGETAEFFLEAANERNMLTLFTGFPGAYWNRQENTPAALLTPNSQLMSTDFLPFQRAINAGARMIRVESVYAPLIDMNKPACLSEKIIQGVLRDQLDYEGVIVSGPLDAMKLPPGYSLGDAAIEALLAGADMIYWERSGVHVMKAIERVIKAVEDGLLARELLESKVQRILQMKEHVGLRKRGFPNEKAADKLKSRKDLPALAHRIECQSVTVVKNEGGVLPLAKGKSLPVGVTGVVGVDTLAELLKAELKHVARQSIVTAKHGNEIYDFEIDRLISRAKGARTVVVVVTENIRTQGKTRLIREFKKLGAQVVVVLAGYPHSLGDFSEADAIVLTYCDAAATDAAMSAVANTLLGKAALALDPPAEMISVKAGEEVIFDAMEWVRTPAGRLPVNVGGAFMSGLGIQYEADSVVKKVKWKFGDGKKSSNMRVGHVYRKPGEYTATLTVTGAMKEELSAVIHVAAGL